MSLLQNMDDIELVALRTAQEQLSDSSTVRLRIYDLTVRALMSEVLTLNRINSVLQAVRKGVDEGVQNTVDNIDAENSARIEACRGLCSAADEVLVAVGLGCRAFYNFYESNIPAEISADLLTQIHVFRKQLEQITRQAEWQTNSQVIEMQLRWFQDLSSRFVASLKHTQTSTIPWTERFLQGCSCLPATEGKKTQAYLMLLGLLTQGVFVGLHEYQTPT
jgi:hypothetical protein